MKNSVNYEIPNSKCSLISIGIKLVLILDLVWNHLVQLSTFKFNLLFIKLIFDHDGTSFVGLKFFFHFVFVIQLRNTLSIIWCIILISICCIHSFVWRTTLHVSCVLCKVFHAVAILVNFYLICTLSELCETVLLLFSLFASVVSSTFQQWAGRGGF